jgi:hypothetical protein
VGLHLKSLLGQFGIPSGATFDKTLHYDMLTGRFVEIDRFQSPGIALSNNIFI